MTSLAHAATTTTATATIIIIIIITPVSSYLFSFGSIRRASSLKPLDYFIGRSARADRNTRPWLELVVNGFSERQQIPLCARSPHYY